MTRKPASKIIAFVTAVCTMAVMCGMPAVAFAWEGGITKEETVYVVTDSNGAQNDVIVSDHLVNNGKSKTIADETTLSDIENVKGEETFKQKGDALTWDAEGNSIYYQGKTDAEVPVTMDITYRLNDRVVSGPELQGKSGKVEIRIHYENNAVYEGTTIPFVVMTGLIVTDDSFKNIKISKGKVIDDGEKLLVVGMAAPGLAQTLGIGESELGFGSTVTITGDAEKFAVEDMMTIVTNAFFEDIDADSIEDLDYDDEIKQLDKGAKALVDGSKLLYDGLNTMNDSMPALGEGVDKLKSGADKLNTGAKGLQSGAAQLNDGMKLIETLPQLMQGMSQNLSQLKSVADGALTTLGTIKAEVAKAVSDLGDASSDQEEVISYLENLQGEFADLTPTQKAAVLAILGPDAETDLQKAIGTAKDVKKQIDDTKGKPSEGETPATGLQKVLEEIGAPTAAGTLFRSLATIDGGLDQMNTTVSNNLPTLNAGIPQLVGGAQALTDGADQLAPGAQGLADGIGALQDKSVTLMDGVRKLDKGSLELSNGMSKLYKEGIKKIVDMYNDDLKGTLNDARSMLDAGKGYKTFTKLPSGMDGNVKFIYKTDMTE